MPFFIPNIEPDETEARLALIAQDLSIIVGRTVAVPAPNDRVLSIDFQVGGAMWIAVVGEKVCVRTNVRTVNLELVERVTSRDFDSTVLAIFPGDPVLIYTDGKDRPWLANPIPVSGALRRQTITLFD